MTGEMYVPGWVAPAATTPDSTAKDVRNRMKSPL